MTKRYQARYPGFRFLYTLFPLLALGSMAIMGYAAYSFVRDVHPSASRVQAPPVSPTPLPEQWGKPVAEDAPVAGPVGGKTPPPASSRSVLEPPKGKIPSGIWLRVVKSRHLLCLYRGAELQNCFDVGVGRHPGQKKSSGDGRTPEGRFTISQIQDSRKWTFDYKDGKGPVPGSFGPWFLRLKAGSWKGLGICGTHDPALVGKNSTGGVLRLSNEDLQTVKAAVKAGTVVVIEP